MSKEITGFTTASLYKGNEVQAILSRQNGRLTSNFRISIKSAGTVLVLAQSAERFTDAAASLRNAIIAGNAASGTFTIPYYQLLAMCRVDSRTIRGEFGQFEGVLSVSYRTNIVAPSSASIEAGEMFVANALLAKASRQSSRTMESIDPVIIEPSATNSFYYLFALAARNASNGTPHIFSTGEDIEDELDQEKTNDAELMGFFNGLFSKVQVLGYFGKEDPLSVDDQDDFNNFKLSGYEITVTGTTNLTIQKKETENE